MRSIAARTYAPWAVPPIAAKNAGSSKSKNRSWSRRSCHAFMAEDEYATHIGVARWSRTGGIPGAAYDAGSTTDASMPSDAYSADSG